MGNFRSFFFLVLISILVGVQHSFAGSTEWLVVVHGISTGATIAPTLRKKAKELGRDIKIAHVQFGDLPASLKDSYQPGDYDKNYYFGLKEQARAAEFLRRLGLRHSVIAGGDSSYPHVDILNALLGLPGNDVKKAGQRTNKELFYQELKSANLMAAPFVGVTSVAEGMSAASTEGFIYPFVLKPADDAGGNGFTVVHNPEELRLGLTNLFDPRTKTVRGTPIERVLMQHRLQGPEFAIQGAILRGRVVVTDIIDLKKDNAIYDEDALADPNGALVQERVRHVKAALKATGLKEGTFHYETIQDHHFGFVTFDPGARPMGGPDHIMVRECTGYNQVDALAEAILDPEAFLARAEEADRTGVPYRKHKFGKVVEVRYAQSGVLQADPDLAPLKRLASFHTARISGKKGDRVYKTTNLLNTAGTVVLVSPFESQVESDYQIIRDLEVSGRLLAVKPMTSVCAWIADVRERLRSLGRSPPLK
jgi:hypothetical protein